MYFDKVEQERKRLGASYKFAMDLASLLTWTTEKFDADLDSGPRLTHGFRWLLERFNACIVQSGGEPVTMESRWAWPLAINSFGWSEDQQRRSRTVFMNVFDRATADDMHLATQSACTDPYVTRDIHRIIDVALCFRGLPPSRERLTTIVQRSATGRRAPTELLTVACLDDCPNDILHTLGAMAGWNGLRFEILLQPVPADDETEEITTERLVNMVIASGAHIILMDHGLINTNGSQVIHAINRIDPHGRRVFVANTGGNVNAFDGTGAIGDCRKGEDLRGVETAIRMLHV